MRSLRVAVSAFVIIATIWIGPAGALSKETLSSVVSVLPVWPDKPVRDGEMPNRAAPEGSGVAIAEGGLIATAFHVVGPAERIDVRLADGRVLPAVLVGQDEASDIALLRVDADLPLLDPAERPDLAAPVCLIANAYGLGLSVTCGVVSALDVSIAGFNAIEDFVQTDAAANPGSSGGALVDDQGRLVGMMSAIFASDGDANIGVNFAVSMPLLARVAADLADDGVVDYVEPGWRLSMPERADEIAGALVVDPGEDTPAGDAGIEAGDLITRIGERRVRGPRDARAALALVAPGETVSVTYVRQRQGRKAMLSFAGPVHDNAGAETTFKDPACPHPAPVCAARQAVFPIESFDPLASAVRIGQDLLVTVRHGIGDHDEAIVHTPLGPRNAKVVPSAYRGDLALLEVRDLPDDGLILTPEPSPQKNMVSKRYFTIGADIERQEVRVFPPGDLLFEPAKGARRGRLHVTAFMQPGVSGGALVDQTGRLLGIAIGGGEGRFEALPLTAVAELLEGRDANDALAVQKTLGIAFVLCASAIDTAVRSTRSQTLDEASLTILETACQASENIGQHLKAGRVLGVAGRHESAIALLEPAIGTVPHSINTRLSLLVSLQLAGRFQEMLPHARWLSEVLPRDAEAQRYAIQSGVWGSDPDLADAAYDRLLAADPKQAEAARRFIAQPPPAPAPR